MKPAGAAPGLAQACLRASLSLSGLTRCGPASADPAASRAGPRDERAWAGAMTMRPARRTREPPVRIDGVLCALRNRIEPRLNPLRCAPRLATRSDKTADSCHG